MARISPTQHRHGSTPGLAYGLTVIDGDQEWVFRWEVGSELRMMRTVARFARDPSLSFDFFDAAVVCECVVQQLGRSRPQGGAWSRSSR